MKSCHTCLICGFANLLKNLIVDGQIQSTNEICVSCGFHYGYDNLNGSGEYPESLSERGIIMHYRNNWIKNGMKWWSMACMSPDNWNPKEQLKNIPTDFL